MAKIVKKISKRKKKKNNVRFAFTLLFFSSAAFLATCLFLKSYNNQLSIDIQRIEREIAQLETENEAMSLVIAEKTNRVNIAEVAIANNLTYNSVNIVTIVPSEE